MNWWPRCGVRTGRHLPPLRPCLPPEIRRSSSPQPPTGHARHTCTCSAGASVEQCRTPTLGGQVYSCPQCNQLQFSYHSCRNRHCPKCQNDKAQEWLEKQQDFLLPVPYFMLTFTLPAALRPLARSHQTLVYDLLFRTSAAATQHLAQDPRFVGGQLGLIGVLHTWGRNLSYHPHIHYLVPAGGLTSDHHTWLPAHHHFLLPVKALSKIFRAKFHHALQRSSLANDIPATVWKQDWVVHCKPVGNGRTALKYLAPYIFRVAISNRRLVKLENHQVTFRYRSSATGQITFCTLSAEEPVLSLSKGSSTASSSTSCPKAS